ncbi:MAG: hypothetical protein IPF82_00845 [Blastocatellia bacterium]|nr:hypothetical protein [Blastocatellia bacterium]
MSMNRTRGREAGFSYVDVMIAMTILLVGILTMAAALTAAFVQTSAGENQLRGKAIATTTLESVLAARFVSIGGNPYTFDSIQHVGVGAGVFVAGRRPVHLLPGPDGLYGTLDDYGDVEGSFEREIVIVDVNNPIRPSPPNPITERRITVSVYYFDRGFERVETITTSVANF